ncbi:DUF6328 family protein [Nocardioides lijunqiniae]|uniref:DUF6328 family protein n=1 Tax=Nocardioides lijunqiniae TaxID=2760832 RepID=UPI00187842DB|nr:DUF6328 family protein [Nocardioides lijunqiniae]
MDDGREETPVERLDRLWQDMLQELRVMQTGVQLLAGILLTLPFQEAFEDLDEVQRTLYLALVVTAAVTTALVLSPVAIHRRLAGRHLKGRLVAAAHHLMHAALALLGLLIVGMVVFVFDVVLGRTEALVAGGSVTLVVLALLVATPLALVATDD